MKNRYSLAAIGLLTLLGAVPRAQAQGAPAAAAAAARRQKLAAQQAATIAQAKQNAVPTPTVATINRPVPTPPPTIVTPPSAVPTTKATAIATAAPTTAAPKAAASASAAPAKSAAPATGAAPATSAAHPSTTAIALDLEALRKSRPDRRHAEFVDLQSRWGSVLADPRANDELKLHAQRIAYLQRIRALGAKDPTFVKSVDALITKEETRDSDALNALRSGALPTSAAAPAAGAIK